MTTRLFALAALVKLCVHYRSLRRADLSMVANNPQSPSFHVVGAMPLSLSVGTPHSILDQGSTNPILFQLEHDGRPAGLWVMKAQCKMRHGGIDILRELAGTDLCALVGLSTPAVGLVRIPVDPPSTDDSHLGQRVANIYDKDRGKLAFCSAYVSAPRVDGQTLAPSQKQTRQTIRDAIALFAIDALIWHHDRKPDNPNALLYCQRVVPIDHERAFFKINVPDESGCAPDYTLSADQDDMAQHIAANLAGQHLDSPAWQEVLQAIERLTDQEIQAMVAKWPDELDRNWAGERVGWKDDFIRFIATRRMNAVSILEEARRAVAKG